MLGQRNTGVAHGQRRLSGDDLCQFPGPLKQLFTRHDLVDHPERQRLLSREFLTGEQEVTTSIRAQEERPDNMHPVARHNPVGEMRRVLEHRVVRGNDNITQDRQLSVNGGRTVDRGDHRHLNVQVVHQQFFGVPINVIPQLGCDLPLALSGVAGNEFVLRAGNNDRSILRVAAHVVETFAQLRVRAFSPV